VGKVIFCGKMKRGRTEQKEPEAKEETEDDAPDAEVDANGRACRQKGWWKRGDVETMLNTVNMTAWVHKECGIRRPFSSSKKHGIIQNGRMNV
jgi:hypothetical protein